MAGALIAAAGPARNAGAAHTALTVRLQPATVAVVQQGVPFEFKATVSSVDAAAQQVGFSVKPLGGAKAIPFAGTLAIVPAGGTFEDRIRVIPSQWFAQLGRFQIVATVDQQPLGAPLTFRVVRGSLTVPRFRDVTKAVGLETTVPTAPCGRWSSGAAWADVNRDGTLDLFVTRQSAPTQLFINHGGRFVDETAARGVDDGGRPSLGASFADYDNDGDPDLFVGNDGQNRLYRNDGTGHFTDVAEAAGIVDAKGISQSGSWSDYDNDGNLDLYVANHARCTLPDSAGLAVLSSLQYLPDHLYHNNGDGTFTDVTSLLGPNATLGAGFLGSWFDFNGDGRQDLYLANDYLGTKPDKNHLWRNDGLGADGKWQFTDVSVSSRTAYSINTMGVGVGDYNRDLKPDVALTNFASNILLRNNGDGTFTNVADATNTARTYQQADQRGTTWGATFEDLNLDGFQDLYIAAGYLWHLGVWYGERFRGQPNEVLVNDHRGSFRDLSAPSGAADPGISRGVAVADYDHDGRLDLYVLNQGGSPHLFRNVTPIGKNHWLEVNTVGTRDSRDGCGARLVLTTKSGSMLRQVMCGSTSVSSGSDKVVHFGLAGATKFRLQLTWPSGIRQTFTSLKPDRYVTLKEPKL